MGEQKEEEKTGKETKVYKEQKGTEHTFFHKKVVITIEKTFRYICMALYVILCMYSFGVFYSFGITPNIIESILEFILVVIELALFVILFCYSMA